MQKKLFTKFFKLPFGIKRTPSKLEREGNLIKGISEKPTPNITVTDESHFYPHFYSVLMVLASAMRQQQKKKFCLNQRLSSVPLQPFNHIAVTTEVCLQRSRNPVLLFLPRICLRWNLKSSTLFKLTIGLFTVMCGLALLNDHSVHGS